MPLRTQNWYNLHSTRRYPLDDNATGTADDGQRLKDDILVDCHLRWPDSAGQYAYISGITVTERLVSVVILAADSPTSASSFTPLAAVSLPQPVSPFVHYNLEPLLPGVGGFLVFGDPHESFTARFSTPQQGLLAPKCARPYHALPVPTLRKLNRAIGLVDLVYLLAGTDLEAVKETVEIGGVDREAIVIRLVGTTTERNVLAQYIGPCAHRPESRNCLKEGIETINGVRPDCNGNIDILFEGMTPGPYQNCGSEGAGVTLDQSINLAEACNVSIVDRFHGEDQCPESSISLDSIGLPKAPLFFDVLTDESSEAIEELHFPFTAELSEETQDFQVHFGEFLYMGDAFEDASYSPNQTYVAADTTRRNVLLLNHEIETLGKRITADVALISSGAQHNGGLIINHRTVEPESNPHTEYFAVVLDRNISKVRLMRFNGNGLVEIHAVVCAPIVLEHWYRISVDVMPQAGHAALRVAVKGISNPAWPEVSFSILNYRYQPTVGRVGLGSDRGRARFSFLQIEEL